ncbi:hypothetical protein ACE1CD_21530 [Aerosakkonema sp. BLCC-F183]|uniref:hypothetical protein n=1 Tax=Aerosakkonema sp. BLCC-F183 TaxID=3342834 RepID=UPI0035B768BF
MIEKQEDLHGGVKTEGSSSNDGIEGNCYKQNGKFGIGGMSGGEIKDGAKVAGTINEAPSSISAHTVNIENLNISGSPPVQQIPQLSSSSNNFVKEAQEKFKETLGVVVSQEHKYNGELVSVELQFSEDIETIKNNDVFVKLSIAFGEAEENFSYNSGLLSGIKEISVRFGIKYGKLYLNFIKGAMPLGRRKPLEKLGNWQVTTSGINEAPVWQFKAQEKPILEGSFHKEMLGNANLSDGICIVEATFKAGMIENDLVITCQNGLWNSQDSPAKKETKMRVFIKKFLAPKLEEYLSKVRVEYDSAVNS